MMLHGVGIFKKLMSALVDLTMLYGVDIWGCMRSLEATEQVQLRAFLMFSGVGTLHAKASLTMEILSISLPLCGQLGSSNLYVFFMLASNL